MKYIILVTLICAFLLGCKEDSSRCGSVYFGGEIINPNSDNIIIYADNDKAIDTLFLDENNRFHHVIENLNSGLHSFYHGGEEQFMVLEANDSVMLRLNTLDFDESLVFSGKGAKKNNYLISLFLELEAERGEIMYDLSKKEPEIFKHSLDSIKDVKYNKLKKFNEKNFNTELFNTIASATIDYHYYANHEVYPYRHYGNKNLVNRKELPSNFYDYRDHISYDIDELKVFKPYTNFLYPHINNLSLENYFKVSGDTIFNSNSVIYNLTKLHLIDSLIGNELIRNRMLKNVARNYLSFNATESSSDQVYASFMEKSTNKYHEDFIKSLYGSSQKLRPGNQLPSIEVINIKNQVVNLTSIINKPTIIYFWSTASKHHFKESHLKINELRETHPHFNFISINLNSDNSSVWKRMLKQYSFPLENEYRFRNPNIAKNILAINNIYKVMIVDENNTIIANTRTYSQEFKATLQKLNPSK